MLLSFSVVACLYVVFDNVTWFTYMVNRPDQGERALAAPQPP